MAARWLQWRLASLCKKTRQSQIPLPQGYLVSVQLAKGIRGVKTKPETSVIANDDKKDSKPCQDDFNPASSSVGMLDGIDDKTNVNYRAYSNLKTSSRHDLAMIFTCKVCETRSVKTTCRESYEKGVVVARCSGCNNLHLIADRLGWFGEPGSVEDFLAVRGEEVKKGSADTLNLTLEDLTGTKS